MCVLLLLSLPLSLLGEGQVDELVRQEQGPAPNKNNYDKIINPKHIREQHE